VTSGFNFSAKRFCLTVTNGFNFSAKRFCLTVTRSKENLTVGLMLQCGTRPEVVTSSLDLQYQGNNNLDF
jgi:hypothetical protein